MSASLIREESSAGSNENLTKGKSAEEILNLRDLEAEKISKTSEKILDAISKENYR